MIHRHALDGCAPMPLAHYLKALGVLRLITEQADPRARGWWSGDRFRLATSLTREQVLDFFVSSYQPTALFNPWGARSGFYAESSEATARAALTAIEASTDTRFETYRAVVQTVKRLIATHAGGVKPEGEAKERLVRALRHEVRGHASAWLAAVTAILGEDDTVHAALFGTGGNEGSGSYTAAFMLAIKDCLIDHRWDAALPSVLFGDTQRGTSWSQSVGQYQPGGASTPWDLLLALEGALMMRSTVAMRSAIDATRWMASPFFVAPVSFGYASGSLQDEYALKNGTQLPGRGEQWFPLWSAPMSGAELGRVLVEGRAMTNRTRAQDGYSMSRAIASLGVQRGLREFVRYGYLQRNNLATHFAVPLGRFRIPDRVEPRLACLEDIDGWMRRLNREARRDGAPARLRLVERRLTDAVLAVLSHAEEPRRWQDILLALADVEAVQITGGGIAVGPIPMLRPDWVRAAHHQTDPHEFSFADVRLAVAFALQHRQFARRRNAFDGVRQHWLPLEKSSRPSIREPGGSRQCRFAVNSENRLQVGPDVVIAGRRGVDDAIALIGRRFVESAQRGERGIALIPARAAGAAPADLTALLAGRVDLDRTLALARAFMALGPSLWALDPHPSAFVDPHGLTDASAPTTDRTAREQWPDDAWLVIRLALSPWPLPNGRSVGGDPAIVRRLDAGDGAGALTIAIQRLRAVGLAAPVRVTPTSGDAARLWAAALAFPISARTAAQMVSRLHPSVHGPDKEFRRARSLRARRHASFALRDSAPAAARTSLPADRLPLARGRHVPDRLGHESPGRECAEHGESTGTDDLG